MFAQVQLNNCLIRIFLSAAEIQLSDCEALDGHLCLVSEERTSLPFLFPVVLLYPIGAIPRLDHSRLVLRQGQRCSKLLGLVMWLALSNAGVKMYFVAPDVVRMKDDIKEFLTGRGVDWEEVDDLAEVSADVDVLYQTRIQKERFQVGHALECAKVSPYLFTSLCYVPLKLWEVLLLWV